MGESGRDPGELTMNEKQTTRALINTLNPRLVLLVSTMILLATAIGISILFAAVLVFSMLGAGYASLVALVVLAVIPFFLGMLLDRQGWVMGFCLSILWLFVGIPFLLYGQAHDRYLWLDGSGLQGPYMWIVVGIPLFTLVSQLGCWTMRRFKRSVMNVEKPLLLVVSLVAITLAVSAISIPAMGYIRGSGGQTLSFPEYGFEVKVPRGWRGVDSEIVRGYNYIPPSEEPDTALHKVHLSYTIDNPWDNVSAWIYPMKEMPYTHKPVSDFDSAEEAYESLIETAKRRYEEHPGSILLEGGDTDVDGVKGMSFFYLEETETSTLFDTSDDFEHTAFGSFEFVPPFVVWKDNVSDIERRIRDVYVFKSPFLYKINFDSSSENVVDVENAFNQVIDSFKFIE